MRRRRRRGGGVRETIELFGPVLFENIFFPGEIKCKDICVIGTVMINPFSRMYKYSTHRIP